MLARLELPTATPKAVLNELLPIPTEAASMSLELGVYNSIFVSIDDCNSVSSVFVVHNASFVSTDYCTSVSPSS